MEEKFIHYLIDIGFIDKKTENELKEIYDKVLSENNNMKFNEIMTTVLINFLDNLTQIQKKFICFHLPVKFINQIKKNRNQKLKNIIQKLSLKRTLKLYKYINLWKNNCKNKTNLVKNYLNNLVNSVSKTTLNTRNNFRNSNSNGNWNISKNNIKYNNKCNKNNNSKVITNYTLFHANPNNLRNNIISKSISKIEKKAKNIIYNSSKKNNCANNSKNNNNNTIHRNIKKKYTNKTLKSIQKLYSNKSPVINGINKTERTETLKDSIDTNKISSSLINNCNTRTLSYIDNNKDKENHRLNSNNFDYYNKLYNDGQIYDEDKLLKAMEHEQLKTQEFTFKPNLIDTNSVKAIFQKHNFKEFQQRQNYFKNKKDEKSQNIRNKLEAEFSDKCSFSPKINKNKSNNRYYQNENYDYGENYLKYYLHNIQPFSQDSFDNSFMHKSIPGHIRLYEDSKERAKKQNFKIYEKNRNINNLANSFCKNRSKVDFRKINYLYKSKEIDNIYQKTKNKVEKEEGLTFKPSINHSHYLRRIYSTFMERNTVKKNSNDNICSRPYCNENYRNCKSSKTSKGKHSKKQTKGVMESLISRLFTDSKETTMKSSDGCSKLRKDFSLKNTRLNSKK